MGRGRPAPEGTGRRMTLARALTLPLSIPERIFHAAARAAHLDEAEAELRRQAATAHLFLR